MPWPFLPPPLGWFHIYVCVATKAQVWGRFLISLATQTMAGFGDTYRVAYLVLKKGLQHMPTTKIDTTEDAD
jgi:hypothetical protein